MVSIIEQKIQVDCSKVEMEKDIEREIVRILRQWDKYNITITATQKVNP